LSVYTISDVQKVNYFDFCPHFISIKVVNFTQMDASPVAIKVCQWVDTITELGVRMIMYSKLRV